VSEQKPLHTLRKEFGVGIVSHQNVPFTSPKSLMRMCPTVGPNHATTTNRWHVRNGMFYQDGEPYKIVKLAQSEFDYEAVKESGVQVDGKFIVTCPVGSFSPLYRTTRAKAEQ
jgi:hypothetical protein